MMGWLLIIGGAFMALVMTFAISSADLFSHPWGFSETIAVVIAGGVPMVLGILMLRAARD